MEIEVKFCPCNFEDELEEVKDKLDQLPNVRVEEDICLLYCGQCLVQPFAVVDGDNIAVDEPEELYDSIISHVEKKSLKQAN